MTKAELENIIEERNVMTMSECKKELADTGTPKSTGQIIEIIANDEILKIKEIIGDDLSYDMEDVTQILKNFSCSTATRQKNDLRAGMQVWGPHPIDLSKNIKVYYPQIEVAAVMYLQSNAVVPFAKPSLARLLATRHD